MNEIQEAISRFKKELESLDTVPLHMRKITALDGALEARKLAIEALEKQIPIKADEDDCCILCHTYLKDDNDVEGEYCPNCGQKYEWQI